jgi:ABC-2 type transport system permease protein
MTDALRAEWVKLRTLPGTGWLLAAAVVATIAISAAVAATTHVTSSSGQDPTKVALAGIDLGQVVVAVFAVLAVSDEYSTGMMRTTLTAVPRRFEVLTAKAANVACLAGAAGIPAVVGCTLSGRLLLPDAGLGPAHGYAPVSLTDSSTLRAAVGSVVYLILIALLSLGVATAIRDTAVSIGTVLAVLYLPVLLAQSVADPLRRHLEQTAPMTAGLAVQATTNLRTLPIAPWAGLGVLAAWAAGSLLLGGLLLQSRDA